jgi:hypothetical protein
LNNCTLTSNSASRYGGGASDSSLNNCTLAGNSASNRGGGVSAATLNNCILTGNSAGSGGGASGSTLNNCTLTGNSASTGGGTFEGMPRNCLLYYNTATTGPNHYNGTLYYCCTTPFPGNGSGHITAEPLFVDRLNGNLRLQSNSPCINAGANAYVTINTDLRGRPRIVGGTVDIGAYEVQAPSSVISYAWLQQYGLPTDGSADYTDPDNDGLNNWQEWLCGTKPTNALSALRLFPLSATQSAVTVNWKSVTNRTYFLERSTNLAAHPPFLPLATGLPGQRGTTTFTDTNAPRLGPCFYRVGIQP